MWTKSIKQDRILNEEKWRLKFPISAKVFNFFAHTIPPFPGKTRILNLYNKVCEGVPVRTYYGVRMGLHFDDFTNRAAILGWYGDEVADAVRTLDQNDAFLDIGANAGLYSLVAAQKVGHNGVIVAFEPQMQLCARLLQNCLFNEVDNIVVLGVGVAATTHSARFHSFDKSHTGVSRPCSAGHRMAWLVNIKSDMICVRKMVHGRKLVIKIDTEGAELHVLKGIGDIIEENLVKTIIVEIDSENLSYFGTSSSDIYEFLGDRGFQPILSKRGGQGHYDEIFVASS